MPQFIRSSRSRRAPLRVIDVRPDDTDARDYIFQPSLTLAPPQCDRRGYAPILDQGREGACVGFALATVINVSLGQRGGARTSPRRGSKRSRRSKTDESVSPRMLYEMAKRHDEWNGEHYEGTSLRGAMKGWHKHGVTSARLWPYNEQLRADRQLTPERARDAFRRPIGAYYRIIDSDVSHVQAAVIEGDAVLASAWVHGGWQHENLNRSAVRLPMIEPGTRTNGLHAFAIVGYTTGGFIIQNSWGEGWGGQGCALLPYDDWFTNRQDAWVARPGPETRDSRGEPRIFAVAFAGAAADLRASTAAAGLDLDPRVLSYVINTGDRGALSATAQLETKESELPAMASLALTAAPRNDGCRHVVLYAHGGLNGEAQSAVNAGRLWAFAAKHGVTAYFFIWETGIKESVFGWFKSDDDATGPARFSWQDAWDSIQRGARETVRATQKALGKGLAPVVRNVFWDEMKGRAEGASKPRGGAALFTHELFRAIARSPNDRYKIHLVGHSAGSIYLAFLYKNVLSKLLPSAGNVELASLHMMAPAITIESALDNFVNGTPAAPKSHFLVYTLKTNDENNDSIQIYPSSLLTYVADCLERPGEGERAELLGIREDFDRSVKFATRILATTSGRHGEFDDAGHEIETILTHIGAARF